MMAISKPVRDLTLLWLVWAVLVLGFQAAAVKRFSISPPDRVLEWTEGETVPGAHSKQPYLLEPFMNRQVAYDSEFYLSIALAGYDDPGLRAVWLDPDREPAPIWGLYPLPFGIPNDYESGRPPGVPATHERYSLNYAFYPFYPLMIRLLYHPLRLIGLNMIATATLAGVILSLLGALAGMLALYDLFRDKWEQDGAKKAAFYLIAFPTGFFLAMVHTEGLFVGLSFGALALLNRRRWGQAALLAACATLTRAVGISLILPFAVAWLGEALPYFKSLSDKPERRPDLIWKGALSLSPLAAFGLWYALLGQQFRAVEAAFFSRAFLAIGRSFESWNYIYQTLFDVRDKAAANWIAGGMIVLTVLLVSYALLHGWLERKYAHTATVIVRLVLWALAAILAGSWILKTINEQRTLYYMLEFSAVILALTACAWTLQSMPGPSLFGLMVIFISFFSAVPQGMHRYILGVPSVFLMLGQLGQKDEVFDRAWTLGSVLVMGLLAMLFAFDFWVG